MRNYVVVYVFMYVSMYVWLLTMLNSFAFVNRKFLQCIILYCMFVCMFVCRVAVVSFESVSKSLPKDFSES